MVMEGVEGRPPYPMAMAAKLKKAVCGFGQHATRVNKARTRVGMLRRRVVGA